MAARTRPASPAWKSIALGALVLAAALIPSLKSLGYDLVWDDTYILGPRLDVHGPADIARIWATPFDATLTDESLRRNYFRPAVLFSFSLDRALAPGDPARAHHAQNLVWYAALCLFLWLLAWECSGAPLAATVGAVLFALHPTHAESVCFASGRTDLVAGASIFAALWAAARFGAGISEPWRKLWPAAAALLPGLFAKEIAFFAAPLLPLALWIRDRRTTGRDLLRASVAVAAAAALYLVARASVLGPPGLPSRAPVEGFPEQLLTSLGLVARYLALLVAPVALSARHQVPVSHSLADPWVIAGTAAVLAAVVGLLVLARRRSPWSLPLGVLVLPLFPLCNVRILSGALLAERFLLVPSGAIALGFALLPAFAPLPGFAPRRATREGRGGAPSRAPEPADAGQALLLAGGALAIWYAALLQPRVAIWKDEGTLYASMLRDSPRSAEAHGMAGGYFHRQGDLRRAAEHYRRAYELYPETGEMLLDLVAAEDEMGRADSARIHARLLVTRFPDFAAGWYALGNQYARGGENDSARAAYEEALRIAPRMMQAENNLGVVLERLGRTEDAIARYRRALDIDPEYDDARNNLSRLTGGSR
jgi:tetratricopeptide (TPR) repeat protein